MPIHFLSLPWDTMIFSHVDDDTGAQTHFAITHALAWIKEHESEVETLLVGVEQDTAQMIFTSRGIEDHRLAKLLRGPVDNFPPVLFVLMPDDTHLLIDGSHRYVAASMLKADGLLGFVLTWEQAQQFVIEGLPEMTKEQVVGGYSGL